MSTFGDLFAHVLYAFYLLMIVVVPAFCFYLFGRLWVWYIRADYNSKQKYVLLELKLPKEITKSPAAMEVFLIALYQTGAATYLEIYWQGKGRPMFSLEMASIEGKVKFFIYTRATFRNIVESQIYAQYPGVEIHESPDYTDLVEHGKHLDMWGTYFVKKQEDVFPIKSYIDYGLDKDPKEEFKVDPLTAVLEYLGSLGKDEYAWIQIIIMAHKEEGIKEGRLFEHKITHWKEHVKHKIHEIKEEAAAHASETEIRSFQNLTKGQQDLIGAMERHMTKYPFEVCIRGFYFGPRDTFNSNLGITGLIGTFRQYSSPDMNEVGLGWFTDHEDFGKDIVALFDWFPPIRNFMRRRRDNMEQHMMHAYKERGAFEPPFTDHHVPFIMTTEELATIFHFPGNVAATPTFDRIPAKKAEAPSNLPT